MDDHAPDRKPFPCPTCGATDRWRAHYVSPASRGVTALRVEADGALAPEDYYDDEKDYGAEADDFYECGACLTQVNPDDGSIHHEEDAQDYVRGQKENNP